MTTEAEKLVKALEFYRDGFEYHPKHSRTGLNLSVWRPKQALLDDCGNLALEALRAAENNGPTIRYDGTGEDALRKMADAESFALSVAPAATVKTEGWQDAIDRIVPALEPVSEDYPAEWALWQDRKRIRGDLAALANKPACQTCNGRGEIGGTYGQTAESFGYFSEPCPDCSASPSPVTVGNPQRIEYAAKIVFEAMRLAAKEAGFDAPAWVERGNSNMQEEARRTAFRILSELTSPTEDSRDALIERLTRALKDMLYSANRLSAKEKALSALAAKEQQP